jgi:hypothetical protein
MKAASS